MKYLFILCLLLSTTAFSNTTIEEQVFVTGYTQKQFDTIKKKTELIIDHVFKSQFELYGPKGMTKYLDMIGVQYIKASAHKHIDNFNDYPDFSQITKALKELAKKYPKILSLTSVGKSQRGRELWVMKISDNVDADELEPEFKYISSMHGDEITGRELMVELIEYLAKNYNKDSRVTKLINSTEIYIMPSMNPDGSESRRRSNANYKDLNRDFPDWMRGDTNRTNSRQIETVSVMNWQKTRNFALSANFHGGAVVVNYPWDTTKTRHPFDRLVKSFSKQYADLNPAMRSSTEFSGGITNGADWYELNGGMQDWSYYWHNDLQVTVELSDRKWPRYSQIKGFWDDNKESLLKYMELIHQGHGIKLKNSNAVGTVKVLQHLTNGRTKDLGSYGFTNGEFYKVLETGNYTFVVNSAGVESRAEFMVDDRVAPKYIKL
jgi:hypothetical protein